MRVIYGSEVNVVLGDDVAPEQIMSMLRGTYSELSNGVYNITTENNERVMRITLQSGRKA